MKRSPNLSPSALRPAADPSPEPGQEAYLVLDTVLEDHVRLRRALAFGTARMDFFQQEDTPAAPRRTATARC